MNSRRTFLAGLGAAALAPHALPAVSNLAAADAPSQPTPPPPSSGEYVVGTAGNPAVPGAAGLWVLKAWLSVEADGTGFGILSDRYGAGPGCHLAVQARTRDHHRTSWQGVVTRSTDALLVGQAFTMTADEHHGQAELELLLSGQTFRGQGIITR